MTRAAVLARVDRLPSAARGAAARALWAAVIAAAVAGLASHAAGLGFVALWCFVVVAAGAALVLPLPHALVSPLYAGLLGWLVDMLPFVTLVGWGVVTLRWAAGLVAQRRLPRGGRWTWLPAALVVWTALGVLVITSLDFKHFLLLLGIQVLISAGILAVADDAAGDRGRRAIAAGLAGFVVLLSAGVFLQWVGVPVQELQDTSVARRAEEAYGVDAFPNNIGMIKYARSIESGAGELRRALKGAAARTEGLPEFVVFRPKFQAFESRLIVRFDGSARAYSDELSRLDVRLIHDNVGLAPARTVPRLRSFPRNALTYAGVSAAVLPFAFFVGWSQDRRRRWLGRAAVVACLFGACFSLARGAWIAILLGVVYVAVDGMLSARRKVQVAAAYVAAAVVLTGVFLVKYGVDPVTGRAGGGASVTTRSSLYEDTVGSLRGIYLVLGYGTERPRTESGTTKEQGEYGRYVPRAGTHSTYLNYLFRTGVPGALALAALYVVAALHARAASREWSGDERTFATLATAAMVTVAAHAVILSLYVEPTYTLVVTLVLGLALTSAGRLRSSVLPWRTRPSAAGT
ncbi:MAG TPA: O-antigen ligase family protein [Actinomycetota bacterium]|nr:O-antigen ligase family protein [Actinomycetota bacterium]